MTADAADVEGMAAFGFDAGVFTAGFLAAATGEDAPSGW
jgi:hypothetical protein